MMYETIPLVDTKGVYAEIKVLPLTSMIIEENTCTILPEIIIPSEYTIEKLLLQPEIIILQNNNTGKKHLIVCRIIEQTIFRKRDLGFKQIPDSKPDLFDRILTGFKSLFNKRKPGEIGE